ncbi:MAG: lipopolysaccharide kinase InaA family protein [Candidatus Azotimanducaceae bacterium WSBS_2022_MAG_OTU7]
MPLWFVKEDVRALFPDHASALGAVGEEVSSNWMSRLVRYQSGADAYYIKSYSSRGRGLRRFMGRSRTRAEWENLQTFSALGLPTAELVAYGEFFAHGSYRGTLITKEVKDTLDLATLVESRPLGLRDRQWRSRVSGRLSEAVRKMHKNGFVHNDLKWRNILVAVTDAPEVYLIDCPLGRKMPRPFLARGKIKDLACLDKIAKKQLSKLERLRFYLSYKGKSRLEKKDKQEIYRVLRFFEGRE